VVKKLTASLIAAVAGIALAGQPAAQQAQARPPDVVLSRTVRYSYYHRLMSIPFEVPPGTSRISVQLSYTGREQHTALDVGLTCTAMWIELPAFNRSVSPIAALRPSAAAEYSSRRFRVPSVSMNTWPALIPSRMAGVERLRE